MMLLPVAAFFILVIAGLWMNELSVKQAFVFAAYGQSESACSMRSAGRALLSYRSKSFSTSS